MPIKAIRLKTICIIIILMIMAIVTISISTNQIVQKEKKQTEKLIQQVENISRKEPVYEINIKSKEIKLEIPSEYNEFNVIGKLEIPKINLTTYIIDKTNKETLAKSVTKLCGPDINKVGNLCITGHNYINSKMFWKLNKLELGDRIKLTDIYGDYYIYEVYTMNKVSPDDTSCLSQETKGEREVTLITCTIGATQRLIVKLIEVYD